jgi:hypothetical protein
MTRKVAPGARSTNGRTVWRCMTQASSPRHLAWRTFIATSLSLFLFGVVACDPPVGPPDGGPSIGLSEASKAFSSEHGGAAPAPQTVSVTKTGDGILDGLTVSVVYAKGQPSGWLSATLSTTEAPSTLTLTATPGDLMAGSYAAEVEVSSSNANDSRQIVSVSFTVNAAPAGTPIIALSSTEQRFTSPEGGANPASQSVEVTNGGEGTITGLKADLIYTAGQPAGWLSATLNTTTAPSTLRLAATIAGLAPGTYTASVAVSARLASNSPQVVRVTLTVVPTAAGPTIALSSTNQSFSVTSPAPKTVAVTNGGGGTLSGLTATISYTTGNGWLTASLSSTTAPSTLTLTATPGSLSEGTYTASVAVSSGVASNSPQAVSITLTVAPSSAGQITAFASFDNGVVKGGDPALAKKVLESSELGIGCAFLYIGVSSNFMCFAAALKFDIQDQIRGRTIRKATLRLGVLELRGDFEVNPEYKVQAFADSWSPTSLTWDLMESLRFFQNPQLIVRAPNGSGFVDHDVTGMVQNWASGVWSNNGFAIIPILPASAPGYPSIQATLFESLEVNRGSANRPKLIIEFE